jgi:hypothetical protein
MKEDEGLGWPVAGPTSTTSSTCTCSALRLYLVLMTVTDDHSTEFESSSFE